MDKPRDVGRGASRFSTAKRQMKPSGHKLTGGFQAIGGRFEFSEKSKKEKVRSLSAVSRALSNCQMSCSISEKVDALFSQAPTSGIIASKRFKLPKKFSEDYNGVDHASVPRKLRSAMKKRNRESIFPDSEKVNHKMNGIESLEGRMKKSKKQRTADWSPSQTLSGSITKDEEEVAETLYALAGMFPDSSLNCRSKLDEMSLPENSISPDIEGSPNVALQGSGQNASPSCTKGSSGEAAKTSCLHKIIDQERTDLPESAKFVMASNSGAAAPKMNLQTMPMLAESVYGNEILLHDSELCLAMGQSETPHVEAKPEHASEMTRAVEGKEEHHMIKDNKRNELWPGLSPAATAGNHASFLRSSAAKAPLWPDASICHSKQDMMEGCCGGKVSVVADKRLWKRSASHAHISRLIQSLQMPNSKDMLLTQPNQSNEMKALEGLKHGVIMEGHDLSGMRNERLSTPGTGHSAYLKNSYAIKTEIFQQQRFYHQISKATPTSGVHSPQKQRFDFLSLSVGSSVLNVNNGFNKVGSTFEPLSKLEVPYPQSPAQQHGLSAFPMPQSQYSSTYRDQISVGGPQVRFQLPHCYGSPVRGVHSSATASSKHQHQSFWAVQLAARSRSAVNGSMTTQYPNWQGGRQDGIPSSHAPASLEVLGHKITTISQQQQHLIALAPSLPTSRTSGLDFHLPSIYEESRGSFRSAVTPSLQLLCDERI